MVREKVVWNPKTHKHKQKVSLSNAKHTLIKRMQSLVTLKLSHTFFKIILIIFLYENGVFFVLG